MDFTTTIQVSQMIVNELSGSSIVHKMQGLLFKSQGFATLGQSTSITIPRNWDGLRNTPTVCWIWVLSPRLMYATKRP